MADYKVTDTQLTNIANAIRTKGGTSASLVFPSGFVSAVESIPTGGGVLISKTISQNGTYNPADDNADAYSQVVVNVSGGGESNNNFRIACGDLSGSIHDAEVSTIYNWAFFSNNFVTEIEMESVTKIGVNAFGYCQNLNKVSFPVCTEIQSTCFSGCYALSFASFPECITIQSSAFYGCRGMNTINVSKCKTIGSSAFYSCTVLQHISLPECTNLGSGAFISCNSIAEISLPKCTNLPGTCFSTCINLESVFLSVCNNIYSYAFFACRKLSNLTILNSSVCNIVNSDVFYGTPMRSSSMLGYFGSIYVPASLVDAYKSAANWSYLSDRITSYVEE